VSPAAVDRAMCDAQHIGSLDGAAPERAYQDIPASVARFVWRRDGGRCRIPGCRSARGLELHHVVHRADGGGHDAGNIALLCGACHSAHHAGLLTISGTAEHLEVRRSGPSSSLANAHSRMVHESAPATAGAHAPNASRSAIRSGPHDAVDVSASAETPDASTVLARSGAHAGTGLHAAILRTQAKAALTGLGWKPAIANAAVAAAAAARGADVTLEQLIADSLRRCPIPGA
ncbi:MAG: HNH endonuclease, partial [Sphingomicrobium sp.]